MYVFATVFLFIGLYSGYYVVFNLYDGLQGKYLSVCLNAMALLFGMSRAFVLFLDPYHQGDLIHQLLFMRFMWSVGGPCLTAADSLIILALIETAKVTLGPPQLQKLSTISGIIAFHFTFVLATDAVVSTYMEAKAMILFCQLFFSFMGSVLGCGYILLARKLNRRLFAHKQVKDKEDKRYIFLIYASGGANFLIVAIMFYTTVGPFGIYADIKFVDAWHWYALQTMFRASEVLTCVLVFTVSAKRSRIKRAVEELESNVSEATEGGGTSSARERLWNLLSRLGKRNRVAADDTIDEKEEEMLRAAWQGRKPSSPTAQISTESTAFPGKVSVSKNRRAGRRQSLFSAMQNASVTSTLNNNVINTGRTRRTNIIMVESSAVEESKPVHGGRRGRRQSLFSAMQDASISSTLSDNIITTGRTRRNPHVPGPAGVSTETNHTLSPPEGEGNQELVPGKQGLIPGNKNLVLGNQGLVPCNQSPVPSAISGNQTGNQGAIPGNQGLVPGNDRRGRRRSLFSALQENTDKNVLSHTVMEEEGEEEASEETGRHRTHSLLKRESSLRDVLRRISGLIHPHPKVRPTTAGSEPTPADSELKTADSEPKPADSEPKEADNESKPAKSEPKPDDTEPEPADSKPTPADNEPKPEKGGVKVEPDWSSTSTISLNETRS